MTLSQSWRVLTSNRLCKPFLLCTKSGRRRYAKRHHPPWISSMYYNTLRIRWGNSPIPTHPWCIPGLISMNKHMLTCLTKRCLMLCCQLSPPLERCLMVRHTNTCKVDNLRAKLTLMFEKASKAGSEKQLGRCKMSSSKLCKVLARVFLISLTASNYLLVRLKPLTRLLRPDFLWL